MSETTRRKTELETLQLEIQLQQRRFEKQQAEITEWILRRKIEAGAITANCIEQLDKGQHACKLVQQVVDQVRKATALLAEAVKIPQIAQMICEKNGEKSDKQLFRDLENADAAAKSALIFLIQVKDIILDADTKLKSTGWLSDRPPKGASDNHRSELDLGEAAEERNEPPVSKRNIVNEQVATEKPANTREDWRHDQRPHQLETVDESIALNRKVPIKKSKPANEKANRHRIDGEKLEALTRRAEELSKQTSALFNR